MFNFKIKCITLSLVIILPACGGSGGGSEETDSSEIDPLIDSELTTPLTRFEWPPTDKTYVKLASTLYQGMRLTFSFLGSGGEFVLTSAYFFDLESEANDCKYGGSEKTTINRLSKLSMSVGDFVETDYSSCGFNKFYTENGTTKVILEGLENIYWPDNNYTLRIGMSSDIDRTGDVIEGNNGNYNYDLRYTSSNLAGIIPEDNISFYSINSAYLYEGVNLSFEGHLFADVIAEDIVSPSNRAESYSVPDSSFDKLSFEWVNDLSGFQEINTFKWKVDVTNLFDARGSHTFETIDPLVIEERYRIINGNNSERYDYALEGELLIVMDTNERIQIKVNKSLTVPYGNYETPEVPNVFVAFDADADGIYEASDTITWQDFYSAFLSY